MSNWTHVAAVARIDSMGQKLSDYTKIFGKEVHCNSPKKLFIEKYEHPERFLPCGSEGSLYMTVHIIPNDYRHTVTIFGDLRDYYNPQSVIDWFADKLKGLCVRQAVITASDSIDGVKSWTYEDA